MNRYSQQFYSDFSELPMLQLPYEELDQVLGQAQQTKDVTDALAAQGIDSLDLEGDINLANQVRDWKDKMTQELASIAESGDTTQYLNALRKAQRQLIKEYSPQGAVGALKARKQAFSENSKALVDMLRKSNADQRYINAALGRYRNQIGDPVDPAGGYRGISSPTMGKYEDIPAYLIDQLDGFKADGRSIIKQNGILVWEDNLEAVRPEEVQAAAMELLSNPRFSTQLDIEKEMIPVSDSDMLNYIAQQRFAGMDTEQMQTALREAGFDPGPIDGAIGPRTQAALDAFTQSELESNREAYDPSNMQLQKLMKNYVNPVVRKLAYQKQDIQSLQWDKYAFEKWKRDLDKKEEGYVPPLLVPGVGVKRDDELAKLADKPKKLQQHIMQAEQQLTIIGDKLAEMRASGDTPQHEINQMEARLQEQQFKVEQTEYMLDQARQKTLSQHTLEGFANNLGRVFSRGTPDERELAITQFNGIYEEYKEVEEDLNSNLEKRQWLASKMKEYGVNPVLFKTFVPEGGLTEQQIEAGYNTAAAKVLGKFKNRQKTIEKANRENFASIIQERENRQPVIRIYPQEEIKNGIRREIQMAVAAGEAMFYDGETIGPVSVEKAKEFSTMLNSSGEDVPSTVDKRLSSVGLVPGGVNGQGNTAAFVDQKDNKQYYVVMPNSNLDYKLGRQIINEYGDSELDVEERILGEILQSPTASNIYQTLQYLSNEIPKRFAGGELIVRRLPNDQYEVEESNGNKVTFPNALLTAKAINNY